MCGFNCPSMPPVFQVAEASRRISPLSKSCGCVFSAIVSSISQPRVMLFKESTQRIHHVLRVTASRGKDDMEGPTLNEVRDSLGGIGGVVHELPPLSTRDGSRLTDLDASNR